MSNRICKRAALLLFIASSWAIVGAIEPQGAGKDAETYLQKTLAAILDDRWEEAEEGLQAASRELSHHPDFHYLWAMVFHHRRELPRALESLERAIVLAPGVARYYLLRGRLYEELKDWRAARENYQKARELAPQGAQAALGLGRVLLEEWRAEDAARVLEEAIRQLPDHAGLHIELGRIQRLLGRQQQARASYENAVTLNPELAAGHGALGSLYREDPATLGEAVLHLQEAIRLDPRNPQWHYELGLAYRKQGNFEAAQAALEKATELAPNSTLAFSALADVYREQGFEAQARQARQRFAELAEESDELAQHRARWTSDFKRAQELEFTGRTEEALQWYQKLLREMPDRPEIYFALARLHMNTGDLRRAEENIQLALLREPNEAESHALYALILFNTRLRPQAIAELQAALRLRPLQHGLQNLLGNWLLEAGETAAAIEAYRRAVELAPDKPDYRLNLSAAYRRHGDEAAAEREWKAYQQLLKQNPHP